MGYPAPAADGHGTGLGWSTQPAVYGPARGKGPVLPRGENSKLSWPEGPGWRGAGGRCCHTASTWLKESGQEAQRALQGALNSRQGSSREGGENTGREPGADGVAQVNCPVPSLLENREDIFFFFNKEKAQQPKKTEPVTRRPAKLNLLKAEDPIDQLFPC